MPITLAGDDGTGNPFCAALNSDTNEVLRRIWLDRDVEVSEGSIDTFLRSRLHGG